MRGWWVRLRIWAADQAMRAARFIYWRPYLLFDYPATSRPEPRYGHGRPPHQRLAEIIGQHRDAYADSLELIGRYREALLAIERESKSTTDPRWLNDWLPALDAASLYGFVRAHGPARLIEIGSGMSTRFVARAKRDGALATHITSIDPYAQPAIDELVDVSERTPLEALDLGLFDTLREGDLLYVDGTHRVFTNSDATVFFLDVLPALAPGVLVGIHDVLLPEDYLPEWTEYRWSEQYLLAAYLLAGCSWLEPVLACRYVSMDPQLRGRPAELWNDPRMEGVAPDGWCFWLRIGAH